MYGSNQVEAARALIEHMFASAVAASDPMAAVSCHLHMDGDALLLDERSWPVRGRLVVVGAGKAALPMASAVEQICGELVDTGLVITKDGHATGPELAKIEIVEAAHPIPDQRGVDATQRILASVEDLGPDDIVLALISGGGSALLEAPVPGVSLEDMAQVTDLLLRAGAPIQDLNSVRRPLSQVKGGGLLRAAGEATVLSLILSDVLGNDPQVIASGPTVLSPTTGHDAMVVLARYGLSEQVPSAVRDALQSPNVLNESPYAHGDSAYAVVADNQTAVDAAVAAAERSGKRVQLVWREKEGEASELGADWVHQCREAKGDADVIIGGGEATVTVRGEGVGGRNTEFALAAAIALDAAKDVNWVTASLATDGQDGPTGVAGAISDDETVLRARSAGLDPRAALEANDSLRVFEAAGGIVCPGPTGTNVNDLYIAIRLNPAG